MNLARGVPGSTRCVGPPLYHIDHVQYECKLLLLAPQLVLDPRLIQKMGMPVCVCVSALLHRFLLGDTHCHIGAASCQTTQREPILEAWHPPTFLLCLRSSPGSMHCFSRNTWKSVCWAFSPQERHPSSICLPSVNLAMRWSQLWDSTCEK